MDMSLGSEYALLALFIYLKIISISNYCTSYQIMLILLA